MKTLRTLAIIAALLLGVASFAHTQTDQIDFSHAAIVNAPDVHAWPITTAITQISFSGGKTRVEFTKKNGATRWPDVTPAGWTGPLEFTLWLCVKTPDWTCSGFIQFWNGRDGSGSPTDPDVPSLYHSNWYYAARWSPIYGHGAIQSGETIAFLVTSGNQRDSVGPNSVQERSNVVVVQATDNGTFDFSGAPTPPSPDPPPPTPLPSDLDARVTALQIQMFDVFNRLAAINDYAQTIANRSEAINTALDNRLKAIEAKPIPVSCTVRAIGVTFSCRLN